MKRNSSINIFIILLILSAASGIGCKGRVFKTLLDPAGDTTPPEVVSVMSTSYEQVRIEFTEEIDSATGTDPLNYAIDELLVLDAAVDSGNPKVVRLTTTPQLSQDYTLTVTIVEDQNGNAIAEPFNGIFPGAVNEPRIAGITASKVNEIQVEFSEDVDLSSAVYTINPELTVNTTDYTSPILTITILEEMLDTNYTFSVSGVEDLEGYSLHPLYSSLSFEGDARPGIAAINSTSTTSIRVKFTEGVSQATADVEGNYTIEKLDSTPLSITSATRSTADPTIVDIVTADQLQVSYKVKIQNVQDLNGNAVTALPADFITGYFLGNGPPAIASVGANGPYGLTVTFTESIDPADDTKTLTASNYTAEGLTISGAAWPAGGEGDRTVVELITSLQLQQAYTLVLAPDTLRAADDGAYITTGSNSISFQGDGIPGVLSAVAVDSTHVKVVFSEPVDKNTAENTSHYSIAASGYPSLEVDSAARNPDPNTNEVILTSSTQLYVNYNVTVTGVQDLTGNTIAGANSALFAGIGTDNIPPAILTARALSDTAVRIYFNEGVFTDGIAGLNSSENPANYSVRSSSSAELVITAKPLNGESLTITVGSDSITLNARDNGSGGEDLSSGFFACDTGLSDLTVAYSLVRAINSASGSPVRAYLRQDYYSTTGTTRPFIVLITESFSSDIELSGDLTGYASTVTPAAVTPVSTAVRSDGNFAQVDLALSAALAPGMYELSVKNVKDLAVGIDNAIPGADPQKSVLTVQDITGTLPVLLGIYPSDSTHATLLFNRPLDLSYASDTGNYLAEQETSIVTLTSGTNAGDKLTIDFDSGSSRTFTCGNNAADFIWKKTSSITDSAINIAGAINTASVREFYAHAHEGTVYIVRYIAGIDKTIDSVSVTAGTMTIHSIINETGATADTLTVNAAILNDSFPRELSLVIDSATALDAAEEYAIAMAVPRAEPLVAGVLVPSANGLNGGLPGDTSPPEVIKVESLSDSLVRVIFSDIVDETTAETQANYSIAGLNLISPYAVRDSSQPNTVLLYTELQAAVNYTITIENVEDTGGTPIPSTDLVFSGMTAVSVDNGPVGNSISGFGNIDNDYVTAMQVYNSRLYIATFNSSSGVFLTEIHASDSLGVYFTLVNEPGFGDFGLQKQRQTGSFAVFDIDGDFVDELIAATADTPSETSHLFSTKSDMNTIPHVWTDEYDFGGNKSINWLMKFGPAGAQHLYALTDSVGYWNGSSIVSFALGDTPSRYIDFGGRMYVGCSGVGFKVYRSKGANVAFPQSDADFEKVVDAETGQGMDNYDLISDPANTSVTSMAVFNGYIYAGTVNVNGAQIWRSQDGLTWRRVNDFDVFNDRVTCMRVNGSFLYAGTRNATEGAELWRTPDGITWEQFGSNGFGAASYSDVTAMAIFNGLLYIGMEDSVSGGAIFRTSN